MSATEALRVTVAPEAADHVARLGLQREFRQMLDHVRATAPGLRGIEVTLEHDAEGNIEPGIALWARRDEPPAGDDTTDRDWGRWQAETFPPDVFIHFSMISLYEAGDGR